MSDYDVLLQQLGMTDADVHRDMEQGGPMVSFPRGLADHLTIAPSSIHGEGVFTSQAIPAGAAVGLARWNGFKTPLGRKVNHSAEPNAMLRLMPTGDLGAVALRDIVAGEELTYDYRSSLAAAVVMDHSVAVMEQYLSTLPQVDVDTTHALAGGVYARTIHVPGDVFMVGALHNFDHLNIFVGDVSFRTEAGMRRMTGFHVLPTKAGMKRCGYFHAPTSWTTVSRTDLTDLAAIEAEMTPEADKLQSQNKGILCLPQSQPV